MSAVEFDAQITDDTIKIPTAFKGELKGPVHVIVLPQAANGQAKKIDELLANPLKIDNFHPLTRDEAHERR